MKKFTKTLAFVLTLCIIATNFVFVAAFSDVAKDKPYYSAVSLLSALEIIKGYDDGSFGPEKDVTRAEFATMLMRAMAFSNLGSTDTNGMTFKDLGQASWAISDIRTAYDLGIINGMSPEVFAPNEKVTYEQAIKMIVCALGYEQLAIDKVGGDKALVWPNGYMQAATQINILLGVSISANTPAKRWEIARLIYNSLEVDVVEKTMVNGQVSYELKQGKNFLKDRLRIYKGNGTLIADEKSTLDSKGILAHTGEVTIDNDSYLKGNIKSEGLIGREGDFYYREDNSGIKTLVYFEDKTKDSNVLKINANNIYDVKGSTFSSEVVVEYWIDKNTDRKPTQITIAKNPTIMLNGRVVTSGFNPDDLLIDSGDIEFITSASSEYNNIIVNKYDTYVVKSVSTTDFTIVDQNSSNGHESKVIDEDSYNGKISIRSTDGTAMEFSSIRVWNVISVKESYSTTKNTMEVIVSTKTTSGTVNSSNGDGTLEISGKQYEMSKYFQDYYEESLQVGDQGTFYLDKDGKIAAVSKTIENSLYGFLLANDLSRDGVLKLNIVSQSGGSFRQFSCATKIKIDGELKTASETNDILSNKKQLIKYVTNSSGLISTIDTIEANANVREDDLTETVAKTTEVTYTSSGNIFKGNGEQFSINSSTIIFLVPTDSDETSKINSYQLLNNKEYEVAAYDVSDQSSVAKVVVVYGDDSMEQVNDQSPIAIIKSISDAIRPDGQNAQKVVLYVHGNNINEIQTLYTDDTNTLTGYRTGDVIRYGLTSGGYIINPERVISVTGSMQLVDDVSSDGGNTPIYKVDNGLLYSADGDTFILSPTTDATNKEAMEAQKDIYSAGNAKVYKYDVSKGDLTVGDSAMLMNSDNFYNTKDTETPKADEIFVYKINGTVAVIYIITNR